MTLQGSMADPMQVALATATAAAETAARALAEVRRAQVSGLASKPKELELSGKPEEDRRLWGDWRFAMVQFLASKDESFPGQITAALESPGVIAYEGLTAGAKERTRLLYTYLAGNVKGRLLSMLKDPGVAATSNGYEALRRFHLDIEPRSGAAALGLLETILTVPPPPKGVHLRDAIVSVERLFTDYEATSSEKLSEHVKIAALRRLLPAEIKVHMNMMIKDATTYSEVKAAVTEYEVAERRYQPLRGRLRAGCHADGGGPGVAGQRRCQGRARRATVRAKGISQRARPAVGNTMECAGARSPTRALVEAKGSPPRTARDLVRSAGKENHTADKCWQRYKEKDPQKGSGKTGKVHQVKEPETGGTVTAVRAQEVDTSPETELRVTSTGVRACTEDGRALVLIDSGSDEHLCPEDFAPWSKSITREDGPVLRDAQGGVISHGSTFRKVQLRAFGTNGEEVDFEVPFLVAPVRQPILSLRKLASDLQVELKVKGWKCHLTMSCTLIKANRVRMSYYMPVYPLAPTESQWVQKVSSTKMMVVQGDIIKYRQRMKVDPKVITMPSEEARPRRGKKAQEPEPKGAEPVTETAKEDAPREAKADAAPEVRARVAESSSSESDTWTRVRQGQTKTPSQEEEVEVDEEEQDQVRSSTSARKRSELSAEERAYDNWQARQKKRARKSDWSWSESQSSWHRSSERGRPDKGSKGPGRKGKSRGKAKAHGDVRAVTCDYWVQAAGHDADGGDDRWELTDGGKVLVRIHSCPRQGLYLSSEEDLRLIQRSLADLEDQRTTEIVGKDDQVSIHSDSWRAPGQEPEAARTDWVGCTKFLVRAAAAPEEASGASGASGQAEHPAAIPPGSVVDEPPTHAALNPNSRVADMKGRSGPGRGSRNEAADPAFAYGH